MTLREEVDLLCCQIAASRDETSRLERQLRHVRSTCPHENLESTTTESMYLSGDTKITEYRCKDCGKTVRTERVEFNK